MQRQGVTRHHSTGNNDFYNNDAYKFHGIKPRWSAMVHTNERSQSKSQEFLLARLLEQISDSDTDNENDFENEIPIATTRKYDYRHHPQRFPSQRNVSSPFSSSNSNRTYFTRYEVQDIPIDDDNYEPNILFANFSRVKTQNVNRNYKSLNNLRLINTPVIFIDNTSQEDKHTRKASTPTSSSNRSNQIGDPIIQQLPSPIQCNLHDVDDTIQNEHDTIDPYCTQESLIGNRRNNNNNNDLEMRKSRRVAQILRKFSSDLHEIKGTPQQKQQQQQQQQQPQAIIHMRDKKTKPISSRKPHEHFSLICEERKVYDNNDDPIAAFQTPSSKYSLKSKSQTALNTSINTSTSNTANSINTYNTTTTNTTTTSAAATNNNNNSNNNLINSEKINNNNNSSSNNNNNNNQSGSTNIIKNNSIINTTKSNNKNSNNHKTDNNNNNNTSSSNSTNRNYNDEKNNFNKISNLKENNYTNRKDIIHSELINNNNNNNNNNNANKNSRNNNNNNGSNSDNNKINNKTSNNRRSESKTVLELAEKYNRLSENTIFNNNNNNNIKSNNKEVKQVTTENTSNYKKVNNVSNNSNNNPATYTTTTTNSSSDDDDVTVNQIKLNSNIELINSRILEYNRNNEKLSNMRAISSTNIPKAYYEKPFENKPKIKDVKASSSFVLHQDYDELPPKIQDDSKKIEIKVKEEKEKPKEQQNQFINKDQDIKKNEFVGVKESKTDDTQHQLDRISPSCSTRSRDVESIINDLFHPILSSVDDLSVIMEPDFMPFHLQNPSVESANKYTSNNNNNNNNNNNSNTKIGIVSNQSGGNRLDKENLQKMNEPINSSSHLTNSTDDSIRTHSSIVNRNSEDEKLSNSYFQSKSPPTNQEKRLLGLDTVEEDYKGYKVRHISEFRRDSETMDKVERYISSLHVSNNDNDMTDSEVENINRQLESYDNDNDSETDDQVENIKKFEPRKKRTSRSNSLLLDKMLLNNLPKLKNHTKDERFHEPSVKSANSSQTVGRGNDITSEISFQSIIMKPEEPKFRKEANVRLNIPVITDKLETESIKTDNKKQTPFNKSFKRPQDQKKLKLLALPLPKKSKKPLEDNKEKEKSQKENKIETKKQLNESNKHIKKSCKIS